MQPHFAFALRALAIGVGATVVLDLWSLYVAKAFRVRGLDFGLLGRWVGHLGRGRLRHESMQAAAPIAGERIIGWATHYATGIVFAAVLLVLAGPGWAKAPTPLPALGFGLVTLLFPFLVTQPAMGSGFAAARTPDPTAARLRSLGSHLVFGLGLYLTAWALARTSI